MHLPSLGVQNVLYSSRKYDTFVQTEGLTLYLRTQVMELQKILSLSLFTING